MNDAELLARTLQHPDSGEAFREAFGSIFTEHLLEGSGVSWTTPAVVRVMLPLVMLEAAECEKHVETEAEKALDILKTLASNIVDDETGEAIRAGLLAGK